MVNSRVGNTEVSRTRIATPEGSNSLRTQLTTFTDPSKSISISLAPLGIKSASALVNHVIMQRGIAFRRLKQKRPEMILVSFFNLTNRRIPVNPPVPRSLFPQAIEHERTRASRRLVRRSGIRYISPSFQVGGFLQHRSRVSPSDLDLAARDLDRQ